MLRTGTHHETIPSTFLLSCKLSLVYCFVRGVWLVRNEYENSFLSVNGKRKEFSVSLALVCLESRSERRKNILRQTIKGESSLQHTSKVLLAALKLYIVVVDILYSIHY